MLRSETLSNASKFHVKMCNYPKGKFNFSETQMHLWPLILNPSTDIPLPSSARIIVNQKRSLLLSSFYFYSHSKKSQSWGKENMNSGNLFPYPQWRLLTALPNSSLTKYRSIPLSPELPSPQSQHEPEGLPPT